MGQPGFQVAKDWPLETLDDDGCEATRWKSEEHELGVFLA